MTLSPEIPAAGAPPARSVYSVSRLNREVRMLLERGLGAVWVEGELSNFSQPASGHWYFSLKDRDAQLRCAMFRSARTCSWASPRAPAAGAAARPHQPLRADAASTSSSSSTWRRPASARCKREFERLKAKLAAEGLFALERKRSLPRFPRRIGVITSPTGAALRDILHILARRYPAGRGPDLSDSRAGRGRRAGARRGARARRRRAPSATC